MPGDHDEMDPEGQPEEYRRFMDALGSEGLRRLIEHLAEAVEAKPPRHRSPVRQGLAYEEVGDHRRAVEDYGRVIALDPDDAAAHLQRAAPTPRWRSTVRRLRTTTPPSGWPPATPWRTTAVGDATPSWATWRAPSTTSTWRPPGPRRRRRPLQQGADLRPDGRAAPGGGGPWEGHRA